MNSAYLGITQLVYETLHLSGLYSLPLDLSNKLAQVQDVSLSKNFFLIIYSLFIYLLFLSLI